MTAAIALMTGLGTAPAVAQPVTGHAPARTCSRFAGFLVDFNRNPLGAHLAPHNGIDTVATYPGSGVSHMGFVCVGLDGSLPIVVIGGGGVCLDEGSADQQYLVFSEGCNFVTSTTERWISLPDGQLENNHFGNCLSSGNANGATLGGRSCSPSDLNRWQVLGLTPA